MALAHPVKPKGGPRAVLETLEDAVTFMSSVKLRQQTWPCWDHCAREILKAARTGKRVDIVGATRRLEITAPGCRTKRTRAADNGAPMSDGSRIATDLMSVLLRCRRVTAIKMSDPVCSFE
jgi:hypothetical protein